MFRAVDPPRGVNEMRHQTPQRHKEPSTLRQVVVTRCRLATMGTPGRAPRVGREGYLQAGLAILLIQKPDVMKNKAWKMLNGVQNSLNFQLHRWSRFRWFSFIFNSQTKRSRRDQRCLFPQSTQRVDFELKRATGRLPSLQLAPGRSRTNQRPALTHPKFPMLFTRELCYIKPASRKLYFQNCATWRGESVKSCTKNRIERHISAHDLLIHAPSYSF